MTVADVMLDEGAPNHAFAGREEARAALATIT